MPCHAALCNAPEQSEGFSVRGRAGRVQAARVKSFAMQVRTMAFGFVIHQPSFVGAPNASPAPLHVGA
eukprot:6181009-Pleurochrysis_carterae.AAC.1